jgi:CBS domain containing-hemolysin-like protein
MVSINVDDSYGKVMAVFRESMYTRLPVYQDTKENIIGFINIKDLIWIRNHGKFSIRNIMRNAHYTYEYKKTADLMLEMREKSMNVTFVLNEYGATVGMITLEDLLEEIVGEIRDEYDADEEDNIIETGERTYLVKGSMKLDDINDALDTDLDSEDYDSIGGIIIESLDRLPENEEEVELENGIKLKVMGITQNRIMSVQMILPETTEPETTENETEKAED